MPAIGSTVDIEEATSTNDIGDVELTASWTNPDFDPSLEAFYYARVLEIPAPRWTTIQAKEVGIFPRKRSRHGRRVGARLGPGLGECRAAGHERERKRAGA